MNFLGLIIFCIGQFASLDLTAFVGKSAYDFGRKKSDAGISAIAYNVQGDRDYLKPYQQLAAMGPLQIAPDLNEMVSGGNMPLQRTTGASHTNASGGDIFSNTYGYNTGGELTSSVTGTTNLSYGYDGIGQLTSANKSAPSASSAETFAFDAAGNRTSDSARTYTVGTNNRILSDNLFTYTYDNEGNRTRMRETSSGKETLYRYDYRNRLTRVEQIGVRTTEFAYDLFDRRIAKVVKANPNAVPSATTRYFYNGEMIWSQGLQSNSLPPTVTRFLTGDHIDQWLARSVQPPNSSSAGTTEWFLTDRMGTPYGISDNSGALVEKYDYGTFGDPLVGSGLSLPQIGFTGREFDSETGLMYYRARYYDPVMGRFISEDPIGFEAGDYNKSRYVGNGVFGYLDPNGLNLLEFLKVHKIPLALAGGFSWGAGSGAYAAIQAGCGVNDTIFVMFGGGMSGVFVALVGILVIESLPIQAAIIADIPFAQAPLTVVLNVYRGKLVATYIRLECQ